MRLQNIEINPKTNKLEVDIEENNSYAIVVSNGKAKKTLLPEYGETKIITHQGKVKRVKWDKGEEF